MDEEIARLTRLVQLEPDNGILRARLEAARQRSVVYVQDKIEKKKKLEDRAKERSQEVAAERKAAREARRGGKKGENWFPVYGNPGGKSKASLYRPRPTPETETIICEDCGKSVEIARWAWERTRCKVCRKIDDRIRYSLQRKKEKTGKKK